MSKLFCITTVHAIGGTFLDWSIHYLSGNDKFYNTLNGWNDLTKSPLQKLNSHGHQRNHPSGYLETKKIIEDLKDVKTEGLFSFYFSPLLIELALKDLNINPVNINKQFENILNHIYLDYSRTWDLCNIQEIPIIYVKLNSDPVYSQHIRNPEKILSRYSMPYNSIEDYCDDYLQIFSKESYNYIVQELKMTNIWDKRELMALSTRPFNLIQMDKLVDLKRPHLYLDAQQLWYDGKNSIIDIMKQLNIKHQPQRLESWIPIYQEWQEKQFKILKFSWNLDHICESIFNNYYHDLKQYDLDLLQEAIIQHSMIYKYGLNFKTWQLEKFPSNTQDLHKLLETNLIHKVDDIYGRLKDKK